MDDFERTLNEEIDRRIEIMEADGYEAIPPVKKRDFILPLVLFIASFFILAVHYSTL